MQGNNIKKRFFAIFSVLEEIISFAFEKTPRIRLDCMLVPVLYREYENGLLS